MPNVVDVISVTELCHYLSKRYPDAPPGAQGVSVTAGNRERGVLYFHVWVTKATCVAVFLPQRDCEGKTLDEVKQLLDARLAEAAAAAIAKYGK